MLFDSLFPNNKGQGIKVAIVDTGLDPNSYVAQDINFKMGIGFIEDKANQVHKCFNAKDDIGHGTAVAGLIHYIVPAATIIPIKVIGISEDYQYNGAKALITALKYIEKEIKCDVINISVGLTYCNEIFELRNICNNLTNRGIILVSAFDNSDVLSYPAAFDCVIGIEGHKSIVGDEIYRLVNSPIDFLCKNRYQRVQWLDRTTKFVYGNSFLAPWFTIASVKLKQKDKKYHHIDIVKHIAETSASTLIIDEPKQNVIPYRISKAISFPFNKEMHALARFSELLNFEIEKFCDSKYSGNLGKSLKELQKIESSKYLENIEKINWEDDFDTVILGHTQELSDITRTEWNFYILEKCKKHKKNIYSFSNIYSLAQKIDFDMNRLFCPIIDDKINYLKKLKTISAPVLGVVGTSSQQGKFTIQLSIRKALLQRGYDVGQLGTEPSALLFGMDSIYPVGYDSSVSVYGYEASRTVNYLMSEIDEKNKDIILFGTQSHCLIHQVTDEFRYFISNSELLFGAQADAYILCVNVDDSLEYITRVINYLESIHDSKVIALVLSPLRIYDSWANSTNARSVDCGEFSYKLKDLREKLTLPIISLNDEKLADKITDIVLMYFQE